MAVTTTKTVAAKKSAAIPKAVPATKKIAAAKPVAKKPAAAKSASAKDTAKAPAKKAAPRAATTKAKGNGEISPAKKSKKAAGLMGGVTPEQRYQMICDAAYYRAERRGFIGGNPKQDWLEAELEIDQLLCGSQAQPNH
jgi:hypothetical protein